MASEQNINITNLIKKKYSGNKSWEVVNRYGEKDRDTNIILFHGGNSGDIV